MKVKETIIHIISWLALSLLIFYWQTNMFDTTASVVQTARSLGIGAIIFYLNLLILLPRYLEPGKYLKYGLFIALLIGVAYFLFDITNSMAPPPEPRFFKDGFPGAPLRPRPPTQGRMMIFTIMNAIPMLFFSTILWLSNETLKRKHREAMLLHENLESEMRFLKSQINPHFLFNALNNIYSLSVTRSEIAPQLIIKLSDMLRHVVYHNTHTVRLEKEISYIQNYIDFQNLKIGEIISVTFDHSAANDDLILEPMLLIPFVENAFQHSGIENDPQGFIHIRITTRDSQLFFEVRNSVPTACHTKDKTSGIGIENVSKRLELIYPGKSQLRKEISDHIFSIFLQIDCK